MRRLCDNQEFVWYERCGDIVKLNKGKSREATAEEKEAFKELGRIFAPAKGQPRHALRRVYHPDDHWRPAKKNDPPYWIDLLMAVWET